MPTYVNLANFTAQGIRTYSDTTKRAKPSKRWSLGWVEAIT